MADSLKVADVLVAVKLDTSAYKRQIAQLGTQTPKLQANNKALVAGLQREIALKRATMRLDQQRERMLLSISKIATAGALAGAGVVGGGLKAFLQSTDPAAIKLNASLAKLKLASWQLMANIGRVANTKWNITANVDKLAAKIKSLKLEDIDKLLNVTKIAIMVAGFAKMATYALKIKDYFEVMSIRRLMLEMATLKAGGIAGGARGSLLGAAAGGAAGGAAGILGGNLVRGREGFTLKQSRGFMEALKMGFGFGRRGIGAGTTMDTLSQYGTTAVSRGAGAGATVGNVAGKLTSSLGALLKGSAVFVIITSAFSRLIQHLGGMSGVLDTLASVAKTAWKWIQIVVEGLNILVSPLKLVGYMLVDIIVALQQAMRGDLSGAKNIFNSIADVSNENAASIQRIMDLINNVELGTPQKAMQKFGAIEKGSFMDLNAMFQKMFEENHSILALNENTAATNANTQALEGVAQAVMAMQFQAGTFTNKETNVFGQNSYMNSVITGANTVSRVTF